MTDVENMSFIHIHHLLIYQLNNVHNLWCSNAYYAVLLQNLFILQFTLFCRKIRFVAIYALSRGENLCQKLCLWRKKDKYHVWILVGNIWQTLIHILRKVEAGEG